MRIALVVGIVALAAGPAAPADWKLPEADGKKWEERVRKLVPRDGWTVTRKGNEITVRRDKAVPVVVARPGEPALPEGRGERKPERELTVRYVLRFGPKLSADEYDRLAAVNAASAEVYDRLHRAVGLPHKFDRFLATTPAEEARVKAFREAVAKLTRHDLPDLYTPDHSVHYFHPWGGVEWASPADEAVRAECRDVEEALLRSFGVYSPAAAKNMQTVGRPITSAADDGKPADSPIRLEIALDKAEYPFRGAIALTITYTNTSDKPVVLMAGGTSPGEGFPGETVEVTSGAGRTTYAIFAVDPAGGQVTIEPGKSWKRTIKDLAPLLSGTGVAIDGKVPVSTDPLPDPFGRLDDYTIRVSFQSEVKNQPEPAFNGKVESNTQKFKVRQR